jgi:uncharacterized membrane protein YjgN (DUF898 family)
MVSPTPPIVEEASANHGTVSVQQNSAAARTDLAPATSAAPVTPVASIETGQRSPKPGLQTHLTFTGTGAEYFRIWVVHALITVLSLGVYSAWAKVRKARWFAQHTQLLGDSFDYHGRPARILLGRVVALVLFVAYTQSFQWSIPAGLAAIAVLLALGPVLYGNAQRFRMTNTSWRGLRFGFDASPQTVYTVCIPLLLVWTSGTVWTALKGSPKGLLWITAVSALAWPTVHASLKSMQHGQSRYGDQRFSFRPAVGAFYALYARALGIAIVCFIAAMILAGLIIGILTASGGISKGNSTAAGLTIGGSMVLFLYLIGGSYFAARLQQLVWSRTRCGEVRFRGEMRAGQLLGLLARNVLLVLLTAGLYWPFAAVSIARYRVQSIQVESDGPLPDITEQARPGVSPAGGC